MIAIPLLVGAGIAAFAGASAYLVTQGGLGLYVWASTPTPPTVPVAPQVPQDAAL